MSIRITGFGDAPYDGKIYGRQDGQWVEVGGVVTTTDLLLEDGAYLLLEDGTYLKLEA